MNYFAPRGAAKGIGFALAMAISAAVFAQSDDQIWTSTPFVVKSTNPALDYVHEKGTFMVDYNALLHNLKQAPNESEAENNKFLAMSLPMPDGTLQVFKVWQYDMQTPEVAAQTGVKTYLGVGITDPHASIRLDTGVNGFHGMILSPNGDTFIEPIWMGSKTQYASYAADNNLRPRCDSFCLTTEVRKMEEGYNPADGPGDTLKTCRLALKATVEYTAFFGGQVPAQNGATTSMNRINGVYEKDLSIRMTTVNLVCYVTEPDPYTNNDGFAMLAQNQSTCDAAPGNANYDIGHVFSTGGGGVAGLGVVGVTGQKARGVTGSPAPVGDAFDIDYVAHEMGHQYGANHTFNSSLSSCGGGNRSAGAAYEVGSGSTIMAYAGICSTENVQNNSDAYFHYKSIEEIYNWRAGGAGSGAGTNSATGNITPTVEAGVNYTIPQSTPYKLTATGSDANGDALTYCWEQYNLGSATTAPTQYSTGPLVRSRNPSTSPKRFVPQVTTAFTNPAGDVWEKLPIDNRTMTWRCTVRDNRAGGGGYATDTMTVTTSGAAFIVNGLSGTFPGNSSQTVAWTVGGGSVAPNVNIYLTTDNGTSYFNGTATLLVANTPNDGSQSVTLPNISTASARIVVEAVGNIFYDAGPTFSITLANNPVPVITSISPSSRTAGSGAFTLTVNGSNFVNGATVRWNGSNRTTTFVNSGQLTAAINAGDILSPGSANVTVFNPAPGGGTSNTVVLTINPATQNILPNAFTITSGTPFGGVLADLHNSDNVYVFILNDENAPTGTIEFTGVSPFASVTQLQLVMETAATRTDLTEFHDAFRYSTNTWVPLFNRTSTLGDVTSTTNIPTPNNYIQAGTLQVKSRLRWIPNEDLIAEDGWGEQVDRAIWIATP